MSDSGLDKFILDKLEKLDDKLDQVRVDVAKVDTASKEHERRDQDRHTEVLNLHKSVQDQLDSHKKALDEYNKQLEIHIRGVNTLEQSQNKMWQKIAPVVEAHESDRAIKRYMSEQTAKRLKWLGVVSTVVGIVTAISRYFGLF